MWMYCQGKRNGCCAGREEGVTRCFVGMLSMERE